MKFELVDFSLINTYITIGLFVIVPVILLLTLKPFIKKAFYYIVTGCLSAIMLVFYIFRLDAMLYATLSGSVIFTLVTCFLNIGSFRPFLLNSAPNIFNNKKKPKRERLYDRDELISKVNEAVQICVKINKNKTYDRVTKTNEAGIGLLICFERNDKLDPILDSGYEIINADVSARLLTSIFFEGTQLHDGAVIIRDGRIYAASAFLPPTSDPVHGKFGARHRAAKGVTQKSDCVALLVSEETGEITIFDDGDGVVVEPEDFMRKFKDIYDNPDRISKHK